MAKLTPIADTNAKITNFGTCQLSATCPFETNYREFTLSNGQVYKWYGDKSDNLPQKLDKVLLLAWGTKENTLKRVFVSWKNHKGMMKTTGMRSADKSLINKLF
jgi:hypothetical protein